MYEAFDLSRVDFSRIDRLLLPQLLARVFGMQLGQFAQ
jgi:hypothetical protein